MEFKSPARRIIIAEQYSENNVAYADKSTLFVFLDESGNLDFSPKGTRYWSLTAFCTFNPTAGRETFLDLMYSLSDVGEELEFFHATEDRQAVRDEVFRRIIALPDEFEVHTVLADKRKAHPPLYCKEIVRNGKRIKQKDASPFYDRICRVLLQYIFRRSKFRDAKRIVVVLSSLFTKDKHSAICSTLKDYLKNTTKLPFLIYFRSTRADINCQLADYCGWAVTIAWERKEHRSLELIRRKVKSQFDVFQLGDQIYY